MQLSQEYVNHTQSELARVHDLVAERLQEKIIKTTASRNAHRAPVMQYQIGDYVYLETSSIRKSHSLAPLRSGPFKVTNITANGLAVYLEGFKHPFNIDVIVPALRFKDGTNPHLTQHELSENVVIPVALHLSPAELAREESSQHEPTEVTDLEYEHSAEGNESLQDVLEDSDDFAEPVVRIVPSEQVNRKNNVIVRVPANAVLDSEIGLLSSTGQGVASLDATNSDLEHPTRIPNQPPMEFTTSSIKRVATHNNASKCLQISRFS